MAGPLKLTIGKEEIAAKSSNDTCLRKRAMWKGSLKKQARQDHGHDPGGVKLAGFRPIALRW